MAMMAPLPKSVRGLLHLNTHPGLQLDKYVLSWDDELFNNQNRIESGRGTGKLSERVQKPTIQQLVDLSRSEPPGLNYSQLFHRWNAFTKERGAIAFRGQTAGPLTLHLARASALENAGICLHPIYGFVYLPGTGLKGMARAYAETIWAPVQPDTQKAAQLIQDVFGWTNDTGSMASAGQIIFLDAWPEKWAPLVADILNNHHASYYQNQEPPGDWDSPVPVYFLAVPAGVTFVFALAKRRPDAPDDLLKLATQWLIGALENEGAGAKTASGYGSFKVTQMPENIDRQDLAKTWQGALAKVRRAEFSCTLELVTPAFLAGPNQQEEDCDLRPATLRGMLRWWWRTMHAGHVDAMTLSRLEAAVWGDTNSCGAVRVTVEPLTEIRPLKHDKNDVIEKNSLPRPSDNRTAAGVSYISFGMDDFRREGSQRSRYQRFLIAPGAQWRIRMVVRPGVYEEKDRKGNVIKSVRLNPVEILPQAQAALWLLCNFGGVGSKSRKGFGCFDTPPELAQWTIDQCKEVAEKFRTKCQVQQNKGCESPTLESLLTIDPIPTNLANVWWVLDRIGFVMQQFARKNAKNPQKKALGLPRNVKGNFALGEHVNKTGRHASPLIVHVSREAGKGYVIRFVAFPSPELPKDTTRQASKKFLEQALKFIGQHLPSALQSAAKNPAAMKPAEFATASPSSSATARPSQSKTPSSSVRQPSPGPKADDVVEVVIVDDPKGKGRLFAKYEALDLVGPILDPNNLIQDRTIGKRLQVKIHSVNLNQKQIQFKPIEEPKKK